MTAEQRIENLKRELAEALDQQAATNQVLEVIGRTSFDLQSVFEIVIQNAVRLCHADGGQIFMFDENRYHLTVAYGGSDAYRSYLAANPIPLSRGTLVGKVAIEQRTVQIPDVLDDPDYQWHEAQKLGGTRTLLGVPMLRKGVPIAVIVMFRSEVRPFTERQIELVTTFAAQGAIAIENARLFEDLQTRTTDLARSVEELKALEAISQTVSSTLDLQEVLATIVTSAVQLSGADAGSIYEFDEASQEFVLRAAHGLSDEIIAAIHQLQLHLNNTSVGQAALTREPVQLANIAEEPPRPLRELMRRAGYLALLAVPLLRENRIVGGLVVRRKTPGAFPQETVNLLQRFASQSTLAIQNARLFQELAQQRRQLESVSQHKTEFLANMSHELRTPLNAVIGFSEVLLERMFGDLNSKQEEYLQDILSSGRLLLDLINEILDLSKVEAGRMELEIGAFFLPDILEHGLTMVRERATQHRITLHLNVDPTVGVVEADERKVKQVIFNLLSNAVKFTSDGGQVDVTARLTEEEVYIAVQDTGIGIAPDDQAEIFEAFQRAWHGPARQQEGTGLGLTLSKKFVELHSGRIWLESQVGVGSTFVFTLPIRQASAPIQTITAHVDTLARMQKKSGGPTILLIEDDPHSIELLSLYLSGAGFAVTIAQDGEAGLELAQRLQPEAIILDILLPRLDGWDFLARAKATPLIADIPVIIVSMLYEPGKGFALGAADYLVKPVSRETMLAALRRSALVASVPRGSTKILVIDDDPLAVELIEAVLQPEGYTVLKATGGEAGVALARQEVPALVILDLLMPEMDGFAVVDQLRAEPITASIPIMILTAKTMSPAEKERLNGRISYLARKAEFDRAALVELVRGFCHPRD